MWVIYWRRLAIHVPFLRSTTDCDFGVQNILSHTGFIVFYIWKSNPVEKKS